MKHRYLILTFLVLGLITSLDFSWNFVQAHEGHNTLPEAVQSPHGGTMQGTALYIELVNDSSGIKLYPLTHELTPISLKDVSLIGTVKLPKKKKQTIKLDSANDHYMAKPEVKGAHRYILELMVNYKGKKEKVTFQVEPPQN